jgi:hypothetical protein
MKIVPFLIIAILGVIIFYVEYKDHQSWKASNKVWDDMFQDEIQHYRSINVPLVDTTSQEIIRLSEPLYGM